MKRRLFFKMAALAASSQILNCTTSNPPLAVQCRLDSERTALPIGKSERSIVELLQSRSFDHYQPQSLSDGHKVGLVIEGGGMTAPLTGGQVTALNDNGLMRSFDGIYACSSGVVTAAHALAGNPEAATMDFIEKLTGDFLNRARFLPYARDRFQHVANAITAIPVMDLDFFLTLEKDPNILDFQKVIASGIPLKMMIADLDARDLLIATPKTQEEFYLYLRATCNLPGIAGQPVIDRRGHRLVDGRIARNCPVQQAIEDGCTHVVVFSGRPLGSPLFQNGLDEWVLDEAIRLVATSWEEGNQLIDFARQKMAQNQAEVARAVHDERFMFLGLPAGHTRIPPDTKNKAVLREASVLCYRDAMKIFSLNGAIRPNATRWHDHLCQYAVSP